MALIFAELRIARRVMRRWISLPIAVQSRFPVRLPPTDQEALSRMRRGQYEWQRRYK